MTADEQFIAACMELGENTELKSDSLHLTVHRFTDNEFYVLPHEPSKTEHVKGRPILGRILKSSVDLAHYLRGFHYGNPLTLDNCGINFNS